MEWQSCIDEFEEVLFDRVSSIKYTLYQAQRTERQTLCGEETHSFSLGVGIKVLNINHNLGTKYKVIVLWSM